jgi:hypothetical protein
MHDLGGRALPAWEAFVSVFGHGTAVVPGQGHVSGRRNAPLALILPRACGIGMWRQTDRLAPQVLRARAHGGEPAGPSDDRVPFLKRLGTWFQAIVIV